MEDRCPDIPANRVACVRQKSPREVLLADPTWQTAPRQRGRWPASVCRVHQCRPGDDL